MSTCKFRLNDHVRVTAMTLGTFDKAGVVVEIEPASKYPIKVAIEGQTTFGFAEHELVLAESAAEVIDEMLAEGMMPVSHHSSVLKTMVQGLAAEMDAAQAAHREAVTHPSHYTSHPSGVECIQVTEHMGFNLGNAVKYVWRADLKGDAIQDLEKARWYIDRELARRKDVL